MCRKPIIIGMIGALVVVAIVSVGKFTAWGRREWYSGPMTFEAAQQAQSMPGLVPVTFSLLSKPHIEVTSGNAHDPFGVSGHNIYNYDGRLAFDNIRADLHTQFHPTALFRVDNDYFLLGRYWFNPEKFQWHKLSANAFEEAAVKDVPAILLDVHLVDSQVSSFYQLWTIRELLSSGGPKIAAECFTRYVSINPRFGYEYEHPYTGCITLTSLLEEVRTSNADGFFDPLVEVLNHSTDSDDSQDVGLTAYTLVYLRKAEGSQVVQTFIARVKAEAGPNA